ncbi:hypothetical protein DICVIV_05611 [Dictyocaulus viviparus]|uniref:Uncharacterized protein n=1 Tax=Dictyocaulus viviparus TaxID=29172 RepID=A0A0D8XWX2_DICVI|nr:hypothetical protein DICVIV_05611 [Dictyocaulus viviparus]
MAEQFAVHFKIISCTMGARRSYMGDFDDMLEMIALIKALQDSIQHNHHHTVDHCADLTHSRPVFIRCTSVSVQIVALPFRTSGMGTTDLRNYYSSNASPSFSRKLDENQSWACEPRRFEVYKTRAERDAERNCLAPMTEHIVCKASAPQTGIFFAMHYNGAYLSTIGVVEMGNDDVESVILYMRATIQTINSPLKLHYVLIEASSRTFMSCEKYTELVASILQEFNGNVVECCRLILLYALYHNPCNEWEKLRQFKFSRNFLIGYEDCGAVIDVKLLRYLLYNMAECGAKCTIYALVRHNLCENMINLYMSRALKD